MPTPVLDNNIASIELYMNDHVLSFFNLLHDNINSRAGNNFVSFHSFLLPPPSNSQFIKSFSYCSFGFIIHLVWLYTSSLYCYTECSSYFHRQSSSSSILHLTAISTTSRLGMSISFSKQRIADSMLEFLQIKGKFRITICTDPNWPCSFSG